MASGVNSDKISIVSNTVDINTFAKAKIDEDIMEKYRNKFVIIYSGRVSPERGLDTPILSLIILKYKYLKLYWLYLETDLQLYLLVNSQEKINLRHYKTSSLGRA